MALQYSVAVNNARLDAVEVTIGATAQLRFYTGAPPANCAAAPSGTLLATLTLPADYMGNAAAGAKTKLGSWSGAGADAGTIGHFRVTDAAGTNAHIQGTCGIGSGDMSMDNTSVAVSQVITVSAFTLNAANT